MNTTDFMQVTQSIEYFKDYGARHRLILIAGSSGVGKTALIHQVAAHLKIEVLNLNLALSNELLLVPKARRPFTVDSALQMIFASHQEAQDYVCVDCTELLFESELQIDPLRVFREWSRQKTIIATWLGTYDGEYITFGTTNHQDYRKYNLVDGVVVCLDK